MSKRLQLSEQLKKKIRLASGNDDIDFNLIAAYESVAASTRPIHQSRTAYDGAVMSEAFLVEMSEHLLSESVPILIMHEGSMLPAGKVFDAAVLDAESGHKDLVALFYVESDSDEAKKIDLGIIDEVSVGALPLHAYCSECDFDYMAENNEMNFYFRECDEGHALGVNGTHLRLTKLSSWKELSLVGKGASDKPKIVGSAKQRLGKERYQSLAASSMSDKGIEMAYLLCSATTPTINDDEGNDMNLKDITDQVSSLSADKARLEVKMEGADLALAASKTEVAALQDKVDKLVLELAATEQSETAKKLVELEAAVEGQKPLQEFFDAQVKAAAVAAELELKEGLSNDEKITLMKNAQIKLAAIPRGGLTNEPTSGEVNLSQIAMLSRNSAFQTK
jgi:hypothetical protein